MLDNSSVLMLKYIVLVLIIPIILILRSILIFYEQKGDRRMRKIVTKYIAMLFALSLVYKTHSIMNWAKTLVNENDWGFCVDIDVAGNDGYHNTALLWFCLTAMVLYMVGIYSSKYFIRYALAGVEFDSYSFENWRTKNVIHCVYLGLAIIMWGLVNIGISLVGVYLFIPICFLARPLMEITWKSLVSYIIVLGWLVGFVYLVWNFIMSPKLNGVGLMKEVLQINFCHGSDLFRFFVWWIIPYFAYLKQILLFKGKHE
jgi:hypothetical protein